MKSDNSTRFKNPDNDPRGPWIARDLTGPTERPTLQYKINGAVPPSGRHWIFNELKMRKFIAEGRVHISKRGRPRLKRYLSEVIDPEQAIEPPPVVHTADFVIRTAMRTLACEIARNPSSLQAIEWRDLERILREVFEKFGFDTELTRASKDGGFDLRLQCDAGTAKKTFLIEVKHWLPSNTKVGSRALSALFEIVVKAEQHVTGLILSTSGFSSNMLRSRTKIQQLRVKLGDQDKILSLCHHYLLAASGIWQPTTDLAEMLLDGTI